MKGAIVSSSEPVTLVGGGTLGPRDLGCALRLAPRLVAADGGADLALAAGHRPEAVIGDLDSISDAARQALGPSVHLIEEQQTTDFDKALRSISAPLVLAVGMTGGRSDHDLAALNVLLRHPDRRCILVSAESLVFLAPPELSLETAAGETVSLFPMGEVTARSEGLEWPTEGIAFAPWGRIGTSNRATGPLRLQVAAPRMLVILGRAALDRAVRALAAPAGPVWPCG